MTLPPLTLQCLGVDAHTVLALHRLGWTVAAPGDGASDAAHPDAVLCVVQSLPDLQALAQLPKLPASTLHSAWVVVTSVSDADLEAQLLAQGVACIVAPLQLLELTRQLQHAVQRKRQESAARTAYATDLATGLPHQAQLLEHMTQLLALREREPAPMVLLVLNVDGLQQAGARLGAESANVLRRKLAVRLRSGLRASDVVAAIGPHAFAVLLGHLEDKADGARVANKLVQALQQPFQVAGQACHVSSQVGLALYPDHGKDADTLLKRATAQAGQVAHLGSEGYAARVQRLGDAAANDEGA